MDDQVLIHGDCLEEMTHLSPQSIDLVLADIPYGTTACSWDSVIPLDKMWNELKRLRKDGTPIVLFSSNPFTLVLLVSNLTELKYGWIWDKQVGRGHLVAKYRPMQQTEDISVFGKGTLNYFPIKTPRPSSKFELSEEASRSEIMGGTTNKKGKKLLVDWNPTNLLSFTAVHNAKALHPTQKPVELLEYLIKTYTKEGDTVLDFTMGSGSTGEACFNTNRKFIGIEKDEKYFKIAYERLTKPKAKPLFRA